MADAAEHLTAAVGGEAMETSAAPPPLPNTTPASPPPAQSLPPPPVPPPQPPLGRRYQPGTAAAAAAAAAAPPATPPLPPLGFAKVMSRDFEYLVQEPTVVLGRRTRNSWKIHVPLGHDKRISRRHAEIYFDAASRQWHLRCLGRNGVGLDGDRLLLPGDAPVPLHDAFVARIASVPFCFMLPLSEPPAPAAATTTAAAPGPISAQGRPADPSPGNDSKRLRVGSEA